MLVNVVHPHPTSWDIILRGFCRELGGLPLVPFSQWLTKLEERSLKAGEDDMVTIVSPPLGLAPAAHNLCTARSQAARLLPQP